MLSKLIPDIITPKDIPKGLILLLIVACLLVGLSGLRYGGVEGWLHVLENWLVALVVIPALTALISLPLKWRDSTLMCVWSIIWVCLLHFYLCWQLRYWR